MPGIGRNLFSVPSVTEQEATTIFALEESRIETIDFTIPLQQVGGRQDLYTFNIDKMDNIGIISFYDGLEDHMLQDVRDYTSRVDFNN